MVDAQSESSPSLLHLSRSSPPPHSIHSPSIDGLGRRWHHPDCLGFSRTDGVRAGETGVSGPGSWDSVQIRASELSVCGQVTEHLGASCPPLHGGRAKATSLRGLWGRRTLPGRNPRRLRLSVGRVRGEGAGRPQKRTRPSAILTGSQQALFKTDKSRNSSISRLFRNVKVNARENSDELKVAASEGWRGWRGPGVPVCV